VADDILWRRTKAGLFMSAAQRDAFADWLRLETGDSQ
jgi:glycerol-3-phosphate dehydrogenase